MFREIKQIKFKIEFYTLAELKNLIFCKTNDTRRVAYE